MEIKRSLRLSHDFFLTRQSGPSLLKMIEFLFLIARSCQTRQNIALLAGLSNTSPAKTFRGKNKSVPFSLYTLSLLLHNA